MKYQVLFIGLLAVSLLAQCIPSDQSGDIAPTADQKDNILNVKSFIGPGESIMELRDLGNQFVMELFVPGRSPQQVQLLSSAETKFRGGGFDLVKQGAAWILRDNLGSTRTWYLANKYAGTLINSDDYPSGEVLLFLAPTEIGHRYILTPRILSLPTARSSGVYYILKGKTSDGITTDRTVYELFEERTNATLMCLEVVGTELLRIGQDCSLDVQSGESFSLTD